MLGHQVVNYFDTLSDYDVYDVSHQNKLRNGTEIIDVNQFDKLEKFILKIKPAIIINCIGILIQDSKKDIKNATYINSHFPKLLSRLCYQMNSSLHIDTINSKLIHISTDCVFSGNKGSYIENDVSDASTIYGTTKYLGEIVDDYNITLRTSIIGPELKSNGQGLLDWFLKQKNQKIDGYAQTMWTGVTTLELAKIIKVIIVLQRYYYYFVYFLIT